MLFVVNTGMRAIFSSKLEEIARISLSDMRAVCACGGEIVNGDENGDGAVVDKLGIEIKSIMW